MPAVLFALLPKCPLCLLGYASVAGLAGLERLSPHYTTWLPGLTMASLALALTTLALRARRGTSAGPFLLGFAAACCLAPGKLGPGSPLLAGFGLVLLLAAFWWGDRTGGSPSIPLPQRKERELEHHSGIA